MMKKAIGMMLAVATCLLWLGSTERTALAGEAGESFKEVASGRYYMIPRKAWLDSGVVPLRYHQVLWFIEAKGLSGGEAVSLNSAIKSHKSWDEVRRVALKALIDQGMLPKKHTSSSHPREFYFPNDWNTGIQQHLFYRTGKTFSDYCEARLIIRASKHRGAVSGDLKWWEEIIIPLPAGKCST